MNIFENKLFGTIICLTIVVAPLILWLALDVASKNSSAKLRRIRPWIRALHWVAWSCAALLFSLALIEDNPHHVALFASAVLVFSSTLGLIENWLKD